MRDLSRSFWKILPDLLAFTSEMSYLCITSTPKEDKMTALTFREFIEKQKKDTNDPPLTMEMLKEYLMGLFNREVKTEVKTEYKEWKHHQWEEDGEVFSMWCNGGMCTGDQGYQNILDHLHQTAK